MQGNVNENQQGNVQELRVVPLGGLGEIGRNMMAIELADEMVVIDAGVLFPEEGMPAGVDFAIPNFSNER